MTLKNTEQFSELVKKYRKKLFYELTLRDIERFSEIAKISRYHKRQLYQLSQKLVKTASELSKQENRKEALAALEASLNYNPFNKDALLMLKTLKAQGKEVETDEERLKLYSLFRQIIYVERNWKALARWQNISVKLNKELKTPVWLTLTLTLLFPPCGYAYTRRWLAFWCWVALIAFTGYLLTQESLPDNHQDDWSLALGGGYFVMLIDQAIAATLNQRQLQQK